MRVRMFIPCTNASTYGTYIHIYIYIYASYVRTVRESHEEIAENSFIASCAILYRCGKKMNKYSYEVHDRGIFKIKLRFAYLLVKRLEISNAHIRMKSTM